jgi:hypothetical protein
VLDAVIGNPDRHADNVLAQDLADDQPKAVISIDLANAAIGDPEVLTELQLNVRSVPPGCFLSGVSRELVESEASPYLLKCAQLANEQGRLEGIAYTMHDWTGLLDVEQRSMLVKSLRARLSEAEALFRDFLDATLRRTTWVRDFTEYFTMHRIQHLGRAFPLPLWPIQTPELKCSSLHACRKMLAWVGQVALDSFSNFNKEFC